MAREITEDERVVTREGIRDAKTGDYLVRSSYDDGFVENVVGKEFFESQFEPVSGSSDNSDNANSNSTENVAEGQ